MDEELLNLKNKKVIFKNDILSILKRISNGISFFDQMNAATKIDQDLIVVQGSYREEFKKLYVKYFVLRINDVRKDNFDYDDETVDLKEYSEAMDLLNNQELNSHYSFSEKKFRDIYTVISIYTTFILEEPIHPVGSLFPGQQKVEYIDGVYYCPVKENNEDNPKAVCKFCIAEQTLED